MTMKGSKYEQFLQLGATNFRETRNCLIQIQMKGQGFGRGNKELESVGGWRSWVDKGFQSFLKLWPLPASLSRKDMVNTEKIHVLS